LILVRGLSGAALDGVLRYRGEFRCAKVLSARMNDLTGFIKRYVAREKKGFEKIIINWTRLVLFVVISETP
jgi:hypothetical protein